MSIAIFPGSFDPVTLGHMDVLRRAAKRFEHVYVCAMVNGEKHGLFSPEQRLALLRAGVEEEGLENVTAELWTGLLADYARARGADTIVKGVRNGTDFAMEQGLYLINQGLCPGLDTVLFCADAPYLHYSSTMVRDMIKYGLPLAQYMPAAAAELVKGWKKNDGQ